MIRAFNYPLYPTKEQEKTLEIWLEQCRELYNAALQERRDAWRLQKVSISWADQCRALTLVRHESSAQQSLPAQIQQKALLRLDRAFKIFFKKRKQGKKVGYPRFKNKGRYNSFLYPARDLPLLKPHRTWLPKLGWVKYRDYRQVKGQIKEVRVNRTSLGWKISFICDLGEAPQKIPVTHTAGIDLGLNQFAVLSDGASIENPRFYRRAEQKLAARQRALSRKRKGSKSRLRAKRLVAKAHAYIKNQRLDFSRKLAKELFECYDLIAYEDLNIKQMGKALPNLNKSISDAGWNKFIHCLNCKAEEAGKWAVPVNPRGTSQRCSKCGTVVKKTLSERVHNCQNCGLVLDRDENAAKNILALGLSAVRASKEPAEA